MKDDATRISFLAASNILFSSGIDKINSFLTLLLTAGQIGIAAVTLYYIFKKARDFVKEKTTKAVEDLVKERAADLVLKAAADLVLKTAEDLKTDKK